MATAATEHRMEQIEAAERHIMECEKEYDLRKTAAKEAKETLDNAIGEMRAMIRKGMADSPLFDKDTGEVREEDDDE